MKNFKFFLLLSALCAGIFSCEIFGMNEDSDKKSYDTEIFDLINEYRKSQNLPELKYDAEIFVQCENHSSDMASGKTEFGHDGFSERCENLKPWSGAGENVAMNYSSVAQDVVNQWLNSSGHKKNIEGDYNYSAVSAVKNSSGAYYYTQIFIKR